MESCKFDGLNTDHAYSGISFCRQLSLLLRRASIFYRREPNAVLAKIFLDCFQGFLNVNLYWGIGDTYDTQQGVVNISGCSFYILVGIWINWGFGAVLTFQLEREVFLREQANKQYSVAAYFLSKNIIDIPASFIGPML